MGCTAVNGLMMVMGTRCDSLNSGVLVYLMNKHRMHARAIEDLICRQPGFARRFRHLSGYAPRRAASSAMAAEARLSNRQGNRLLSAALVGRVSLVGAGIGRKPYRRLAKG